MNTRIQIRRNKAIIARLNKRMLAANERMSIHDPKFNLREIAKHLCLLEDHLAHADKVCPDCIKKHLLTIEALAEEGTCLDVNRVFDGGLDAIAGAARIWMEMFTDQTCLHDLAEKVRQVRKHIVPLVADPREMTQRVASRYEKLNTPCPHRG